MELSQSSFANKLGIPIQRVNTIINGTRGVTAETAVLFAKFFKMSPQFWMNLQTNWDLWHALRDEEAKAPARKRA